MEGNEWRRVVDDGQAQVVRQHLHLLLRWREIARADLQARALALIVEASLDGETLHGPDLAERVYVQAAPRFITALRQLVREIRRKLPAYYDEFGGSSDVRIRIPPNEYRAEFRFRTEATEGALPERSADRWGTRLRSYAEAWANRFAPTILVTGLVVVAAMVSSGSRRGLRLHGEAYGSPPAPLPGVQHRSDLALHCARLLGIDLQGLSPAKPQFLRAVELTPGASGTARVALASYDPSAPDRTRLTLLSPESGVVSAELQLPYFPGPSPRPRGLHTMDGEGVIPMDFSIASLEPIELDGDGRRDEVLIAINSHRYYPSQILAVDFEDEPRTLVDYWTMGNARAAPLADRDGDGVEEILVYGQDNDIQGPLAVLLTPRPGRVLRGRSPDGYRRLVLREVAEYGVEGLAIRTPRFLFSRPGIGAVRDAVVSFEWDPEEERLGLRVRHARRDPVTGRNPVAVYEVNLRTWEGRVGFLDYDCFLRVLLDDIETGRIRDRWGVSERPDLSRFGRFLADHIQILSMTDTGPVWLPTGLLKERAIRHPGQELAKESPRGSRWTGGESAGDLWPSVPPNGSATGRPSVGR